MQTNLRNLHRSEWWNHTINQYFSLRIRTSPWLLHRRKQNSCGCSLSVQSDRPSQVLPGPQLMHMNPGDWKWHVNLTAFSLFGSYCLLSTVTLTPEHVNHTNRASACGVHRIKGSLVIEHVCKWIKLSEIKFSKWKKRQHGQRTNVQIKTIGTQKVK